MSQSADSVGGVFWEEFHLVYRIPTGLEHPCETLASVLLVSPERVINSHTSERFGRSVVRSNHQLYVTSIIANVREQETHAQRNAEVKRRNKLPSSRRCQRVRATFAIEHSTIKYHIRNRTNIVRCVSVREHIRTMSSDSCFELEYTVHARCQNPRLMG